MKLAMDDLIAEYYMENSSFARRVDDIFKEALAAPVQQEPVAWLVYENWRKHSLFFTKEGAEDFKNASQRNDDLSGNLARWRIEPLYTSPQPAQRKPLPDGIPSPDELEALSDGNSGMIFNTGFPTKLDNLACWLREYTAVKAH